MATQTLTKPQVEKLKLGLNHYFPYEVGDVSQSVFVNDTYQGWGGRDDYFTTLSEATGIQSLKDIKKAIDILYTFENTTDTSQYSQSLRSDELQNLQEAAQKVEDQKAEIKEKVRDFTNQEITARQKIADQKRSLQEQIKKVNELKTKLESNPQENKVYIKVEVKEEKVDLTTEESAVIENFKKTVAENPRQSAEQLEKVILARQKDIPEVLARAAAIDTVATVTEKIEYSPAVQTATFIAASKKLTTNPDIKNVVESETASQIARHKQSQQIISSAFGDKFAKEVMPAIENYSVEISQTPQTGYTQSFNYSQIPEYHAQNLSNQNVLLDNIKDFGQDAVKSEINSHIGNIVQKRLLALPEGHFLRTEAVTNILSTFGVGTPIEWVATNTLGKTIIFTGTESTFGFIGQITGIDFGLVGGFAGGTIAARAASYAKTATDVAITGGTMASEAFLGGAGQAMSQTAVSVGGAAVAKTGVSALISKVTTALSTLIPIPVLNWIIGFVGGEVLGKLFGKFIEKYGPKIKKIFNEYVLPLLVGGGLFVVGGPVLGMVGGGVMFGIGRGLTIGAIAGWGGRFLGILGKAVVFEIGTPILVTILVFPIIVALILFIINSGAYIVPYSLSNRGGVPTLGPNAMGGLVSLCTESEETGKDITSQIAARINGGVVKLLPNNVWGRSDGLCITPTMIIMHWSGGTNDNPDGNLRTYETLVSRNLSCQLATDTNDVWLMEKFFEKQVEFSACAGEWNTYSINNEMAGVYFTSNPPPPNRTELELAYDATCKIMDQYNIPWNKIYGHYNVPNSGKPDPGVDFLEKVFIPEIRSRCPNI